MFAHATRTALFALVGMSLAAPCPAAKRAEPAAPTRPAFVADSAVVGGWVVRVHGTDDEPQRVVVWRGSRVAWEGAPGHRVRLGAYWRNPDRIEPGTDVNGDGTPDVTVWDWSGGAHCCYTTTVLTLGDTVGVLATIATGNRGLRLRNLDADPALEVETLDDAFAYWPGPYAASPAPLVRLDWRGPDLLPSCTLTFRALDADSVMREADRFAQSLDWSQAPLASPAGAVMARVLDLLYAGEDQLAFRVFERLRPAAHGAYLSQLLVEMGTRMNRSPYWPALGGCLDRAKGGHGAGH